MRVGFEGGGGVEGEARVRVAGVRGWNRGEGGSEG